jgi:hypothetical protein
VKHRPKRRRTPLQPQNYEHRAECVLHALTEVETALGQLTYYLSEQQGTDWQNLDHHLRSTHDHLQNAVRWLHRVRR